MNSKQIVLIKDFHPKPYGRYANDAPGCEKTSGEVFRKTILTPALREFESVEIDLTGYNRYGRSFLDEAFGGLIREDGFSGEDIKKRLSYSHRDVQSIEIVITDRIDAAIRDTM
jgi:hypothetical protein